MLGFWWVYTPAASLPDLNLTSRALHRVLGPRGPVHCGVLEDMQWVHTLIVGSNGSSPSMAFAVLLIFFLCLCFPCSCFLLVPRPYCFSKMVVNLFPGLTFRLHALHSLKIQWTMPPYQCIAGQTIATPLQQQLRELSVHPLHTSLPRILAPVVGNVLGCSLSWGGSAHSLPSNVSDLSRVAVA
jgi:hypothetical protein